MPLLKTHLETTNASYIKSEWWDSTQHYRRGKWIVGPRNSFWPATTHSSHGVRSCWPHTSHGERKWWPTITNSSHHPGIGKFLHSCNWRFHTTDIRSYLDCSLYTALFYLIQCSWVLLVLFPKSHPGLLISSLKEVLKLEYHHGCQKSNIIIIYKFPINFLHTNLWWKIKYWMTQTIQIQCCDKIMEHKAVKKRRDTWISKNLTILKEILSNKSFSLFLNVDLQRFLFGKNLINIIEKRDLHIHSWSYHFLQILKILVYFNPFGKNFLEPNIPQLMKSRKCILTQKEFFRKTTL